MPLIALSAAYGAAGSQIGPFLAERLGVPFVDRAIPVAVAERLEVPVDDAVAHEEARPGLLERLLSGFVGADTTAPTAPLPDIVTAEDFQRATEEVLLRQAATGQGVILGRGAVAALRGDRRALRVRLTGPPEARLRQAMAVGEIDETMARRAMTRLDETHADYLRRFYDVDINDPALYHLMIDATTFSVEQCVELLAQAAREWTQSL